MKGQTHQSCSSKLELFTKIIREQYCNVTKESLGDGSEQNVSPLHLALEVN